MRFRAHIAAVLGTASLVASTGAHAISCLEITDDTKRLACYDNLLGFERQDAKANDTAWSVRTQTSPIDDSVNVYAQVRSNELIRCKWKREGVQASLFVRCRENTTSMYVSTRCHMTDSLGYGHVDFRVDQNKAFSQKLVASDDNSALGLWSGSKAIPFVKASILGHKKLLVRATPYASNQITMTFDVSGADSALSPLRKACGW